jgi:predicted O-methyltransferase YrrM
MKLTDSTSRRVLKRIKHEVWSKYVNPPQKKEKIKILPGNEHTRFLLPIDYTPSRELRPRWDMNSKGIETLYEFFLEHRETHLKILSAISSNRHFLNLIKTQFRHEELPEPGWLGIPMAAIDAAAIYTMVATKRPKKFFEIGSGSSTCFAYQAIKDHNLDTEIISIDPNPRAEIDKICSRVIREGLETFDTEEFKNLNENDIVFLDGSHRSFMNSDVTVFMIDVLPKLKPGVIVHIHDVFLPYDYPSWAKEYYWNEQYLLAVYLMQGKHRIIPLLPTAYICQSGNYEKFFDKPVVDLNENNSSWRGGGSMWFTHTS